MKVALVTGASGGIGSKIVEKLVSEHWCVLAQYCTDKNSVEVLREKFPQMVIPLFGDFSTIESIKSFTDKVTKNYKVTLVINNAGITCQQLFTDFNDEEMLNIVNVNLLSAMIITREVAKDMVWERKGCIINISSVWGEVGASCEVVYSATKGGLIAFTKALSKELGQSNIRVNCITPGLIDTKMNSCFSNGDKQEFCQNIALGRVGTASEVAEAVAFLASDKASYITGQVLGVNGGML